MASQVAIQSCSNSIWDTFFLRLYAFVCKLMPRNRSTPPIMELEDPQLQMAFKISGGPNRDVGPVVNISKLNPCQTDYVRTLTRAASSSEALMVTKAAMISTAHGAAQLLGSKMLRVKAAMSGSS